MPQVLKENMNITGVMRVRVFREIEARANKQHIGKSAVMRQILCDWYEDLPEGSKVYRSEPEMVK